MMREAKYIYLRTAIVVLERLLIIILTDNAQQRPCRYKQPMIY